MKKNMSVIKSETWCDEDQIHRYLLKKIWNPKQSILMIITLYPSKASPILEDTTLMLITNQLVQLGYGGFCSVNLFSKLGVTATNKKNLEQAWDKETDEVILTAADLCEHIVFAWGSLPETNILANQRVNDIKNKLSDHKRKWHYLSNERGIDYLHPLAPSARENWQLILIKEEGSEMRKVIPDTKRIQSKQNSPAKSQELPQELPL